MTLSPATTAAFFSTLANAGPLGQHGLALLQRVPTEADKRALANRGLVVLSPLGGRVYRARVSRTLDRADTLVRALLVELAVLGPQQKVAPDIWRGIFSRYAVARNGADSVNYVLQPDGSMRVIVAFYPGIPRDEIERLLAANARDVRRVGPVHWRGIVSRAALPNLAAADIVRWIDAPSPPVHRDNFNTRGAVGANVLQDFSDVLGEPMGLGGRDVQIGIFDDGFDETHDDFARLVAGAIDGTRVIASHPAARWHGTLVAGIVAGNGYRSDKNDVQSVPESNGSVAYNWRGMAPLAEVLDIYKGEFGDGDDFVGWEFDIGRTSEVVRKNIEEKGMDLSNHSYALDFLNEYGAHNALRDAMIRGDATTLDLLPIRSHLQVFSAGNLGGSDGTGSAPGATSAGHGYFSVNKQLKNGVLVGSWRVSSSRLVGSSSLGPTIDGRIKPDVVAPGSFIKSTGYWRTGDPTVGELCPSAEPAATFALAIRQQFYANDCGTSLAAPVVTGLLALMLEKYASTYAVDIDDTPPFPSTLRALLLHSADDVIQTTSWFSNPDGVVKAYEGPDFATGFGKVNGVAAVDLIARKQIIEGRIASTCDTQTFWFDVIEDVSGVQPTVRATLVWDDPANDESTGQGVLLNDLDLVLIDPNGGKHYPWQRNQKITDPGGTELTADQQPCNTAIVVERRLNSIGPIATVALDAASAGRGPDHLNNVEQVVTTGVAGQWKAVVSGFKLEVPDQRFSLVGVPPLKLVYAGPRFICSQFIALCRPMIFDLCRRYPTLCAKPQIIPIRPGGPRIMFRDRLDRVILPIRQLCVHMSVQGRCDADAAGSSYEINIGRAPVAMGIEVYSGQGRRVAGSADTTRSTRLLFRPARGGDYFLIFSPSGSVRPGIMYDIPMTARRVVP